MKKHFFLLMAFAVPVVFSSCSFSVRTQRSAPTEQVRTTTQKTTTKSPNSNYSGQSGNYNQRSHHNRNAYSDRYQQGYRAGYYDSKNRGNY
jgi:hypothetical protein